MTRSRLVVLASSLVVALGSLAAMGALYLDPARAAVGPLPSEALSLPADTTFVMGFDVKRLVGSEFYQRFGKEKGLARPEAFAELEEKTGLHPERDVDQVVIAGKGDVAKGPGEAGVVMVSGRFDQYKIGRAIETEKKANVTWKKHEGVTEYLFNEGKKGAGALAFIDDDTLVMGSQAAVESVVTARVQGKPGLKSNAGLIALLERVKPGSTFWMVGDQSLLAKLPTQMPAPGAGPASSASIQLPALQSLVVTGDLDPALSVEAIGEARDEAAAKNLADIVRGFFALAQLQAGQKPELKELTSAVSVVTETNKVRVSARFSYELLESLHPKRTATTPPPPNAR